MGVTSTLPRAALVAAAALLSLAAAAAPAAAHASLVSTSPVDGAHLDRPPDAVSVTFDEPVSVPTGGLRAFDSRGRRIDDGQVARPSAESASLALPALRDGAYVVTWRAVSADGHPIRGAFLFSLGEAAAVDETLMGRLFSGSDGWVAPAAGALLRAAAYAGTLLFAGAALFAAVIATRDRDRDRARRWARRGAVLGLVAAALAVPQHALETTGLGVPSALAPGVLAEAGASALGMAALLRGLALAAGLLLLVGARGGDARVPAWAAVGAGVAAALSFVVDGHTRTVSPAALMAISDVVHLLAAAAWFGGLVVLAGTLRRDASDDRPDLAARAVGRFSTLATVSVLAVTASGGAMAWAAVRQPRALTGTGYGWLLLAKIAVVVLIVVAAAYNNRVLVPAVTGDAERPGGADAGWRRLRGTTRFEAVALVAVLAVTGVLVNQRPAAETAGITGVFETYVPLSEDLELNLVVDPNRAGFNEIHLYVLDATGRPADAVDDVVLELELPSEDIGPLRREPLVAGPGHWVLSGRELAIPGAWRITVSGRLDQFTRPTATVDVVVNPR